MNNLKKWGLQILATVMLATLAFAQAQPPGGGLSLVTITALITSTSGWTRTGTYTETTLGDVRMAADGTIRWGAPGTAAIIHTVAAGWEIDYSNGSAAMTLPGVGQPLTVGGGFFTTAATTKGTFTLVAGSATKTVVSGAQCVCGLAVGTVWPKCAVSGTTLTITGSATDTGTYVCF